MIYVVTLVFNPVKTMRASFKRVDETIGLRKEDYTRVFVDNHWPVDREAVLELLTERETIGDTVLRPDKNLGLAGGFNYAFKEMNMQKSDTIFLVDPDNFPKEHGWGYAYKKVLENPKVGWVTVMSTNAFNDMSPKPHTEEVIEGYNCYVLGAPIINSMCALKGEFILKFGANEYNPYYGSFECNMWGFLKSENLEWVFLKDFTEESILDIDPTMIDENYKMYKWQTTHGGEKQIEYKEWLKLHGKI